MYTLYILKYPLGLFFFSFFFFSLLFFFFWYVKGATLIARRQSVRVLMCITIITVLMTTGRQLQNQPFSFAIHYHRQFQFIQVRSNQPIVIHPTPIKTMPLLCFSMFVSHLNLFILCVFIFVWSFSHSAFSRITKNYAQHFILFYFIFLFVFAISIISYVVCNVWYLEYHIIHMQRIVVECIMTIIIISNVSMLYTMYECLYVRVFVSIIKYIFYTLNGEEYDYIFFNILYSYSTVQKMNIIQIYMKHFAPQRLYTKYTLDSTLY